MFPALNYVEFRIFMKQVSVLERESLGKDRTVGRKQLTRETVRHAKNPHHLINESVRTKTTVQFTVMVCRWSIQEVAFAICNTFYFW